MKTGTLLAIAAGGLALLWLSGKSNAASTSAGGDWVGASSMAVRPGVAAPPTATEIAQAQANAPPTAESQALLKNALQQGNAVEVQRAIGQMALAAGAPVGVSPQMAGFIRATGTGAATANPANYIQTGGAIRYVGAPSAGYSIGGGVF